MTAEAAVTDQIPVKKYYRPETAEPFLVGHEAFISQTPYDEWVKSLQRKAADMFAEYGLPTPKLEGWKFTNLSPALRGLGGPVADSDITAESPQGVEIMNLAECLTKTPAWLKEMVLQDAPSPGAREELMLWHLGNACIRDGLVIDIPEGKSVDKPVEITIRGHDGCFFAPQTFIRLGAGSSLTIVERHMGEGRFWNNSLARIEVGPGARLRHYRIQNNPEDAVYTQSTCIQVKEGGAYESFTLSAGGGLSRNEPYVYLQGEGAHCDLRGIHLLRGRQHGDSTYRVEHLAPGCTSHQFVRSVLDDQAHGVFQGAVHVARGAQKTDGRQLSNALLLSEGAVMDTKPQLEIYADDVKCSHGATTGQLDEEALFYLCSRGIPEKEARAMLIGAFVAEVMDGCPDYLRFEVEKNARIWLGESHGS